MRIIEDQEVLEYTMEDTLFFYRRLRLAEVEMLVAQFTDRGTISIDRYNSATVKLGLLGWSNLQGLGGRDIVSPALTDISPHAKQEREYIVDCFPYDALRPLAEAIQRPTVGEILKNLPVQLNGSSDLPIPKPVIDTTVSTADANVPMLVSDLPVMPGG